MDIKLLRIDSRLVHGQVANNWAGSLGAEAILAVSDGAANDELRKTLMLQTGGGKVKVHVLGVEKAARVYKNPKYEALKAVIVVETPADIVRLLDLGVEAKEVNVGGMTFKQGTSQVSQAVYRGYRGLQGDRLPRHQAVHPAGALHRELRPHGGPQGEGPALRARPSSPHLPRTPPSRHPSVAGSAGVCCQPSHERDIPCMTSI